MKGMIVMEASSTFDPQADSIIEIRILPEGVEPLALEEQYPENNESFRVGFISPEGVTYSCHADNLMACAERVCSRYFPGNEHYMPEEELTHNGWIAVYEMDDKLYISREEPLTPMQAAIIRRIGTDQFYEAVHRTLEESDKYGGANA